jgi:hypothetical protein
MPVPHPRRDTIDEADAAIQATPAVPLWPVRPRPARRAAPHSTGTAGLAWALALGAAGLAAFLLIVVGTMIFFWPRPGKAVDEPLDRRPATTAEPLPPLAEREKLAVKHVPVRAVRADEALEPAIVEKVNRTKAKTAPVEALQAETNAPKAVRKSKGPSAAEAVRLYEEGTRAVDLLNERFKKKD